MSNFARRFQWHASQRPQDTVDAARLEIEEPGPDGIRWGLVNRIRAEIAAGTYDEDTKWSEAEERLLERVTGPR